MSSCGYDLFEYDHWNNMTVQQNPKRRHHTVWQQYLKAWTVDGAIWCLQNGRIFRTGTPVIAVEKDFYKLQQLTPEDIDLIKSFFGQGHPLAVRNHSNFLNMVMAPFQLTHQVPKDKRPGIDRLLDRYASNVLEDYYAGVEASFSPLLERALDGDINFYDDDQECIPFLNYLCTQYMRTKRAKQAIELCRADGSADISRIWNVIVPMAVTNIGADLFRDRKRRKLALIRNLTSSAFITGDQPAINLKAEHGRPPEHLSIYYPISPKIALILGDVDEELSYRTETLTAEQVATLNRIIVEASHQQVFADSEGVLVVRG
jgi:Protein of unknown function (DUF4238)